MHKIPSKPMFNRTLALLAAGASLFASLSAFAQYNPNIQQNVQPNAFSQTGYTNDGTLFMGGQRIGNPHQILHDLNAPSFFGVNANRLSFSDVPSYGQGTLAQMENHTLTIGVPAGNVVLSRLYVTPTNPYTQGVATPHNNYQTYQGVVADAQAGSYQLTVANDNKLYVFKTLGSMSTQSQNILIKELPAHSVFIANSDPNGGAVAVRVTQNGDYAAMQNYFDTVKPYDFSWRSAMGAWADGTGRPSNITAELGQYGNAPIGNNEAGAVFANWVMGSSQVQQFTNDLQNRSQASGNEAFGVMAWDANQNKYVMLDPTNTQSTSGSVSGNMPTLGNNQFGFFGMHTHSGNAMPSGQDITMTRQLGLDQFVIGENDYSAIFTNSPSNSWQGSSFRFEGAREDAATPGGYGSSNGPHDPKGVGGVLGFDGRIVGGNSGVEVMTEDGIAATYRSTGDSGYFYSACKRGKCSEFNAKNIEDYYREATGQDITINVSAIMSLLQDPGVTWKVWPTNPNRYSLSTLGRDGGGELSQGRVLGDITVERTVDGSFRVLPDTYNFEQHQNPNNDFDTRIRNLITAYGDWRVGQGQSFNIRFEGTFRPTSTQVSVYGIK